MIPENKESIKDTLAKKGMTISTMLNTPGKDPDHIQTLNYWGKPWLKNMRDNAPYITKRIASGEPCFMSDIPLTHKDIRTIVIIASGASLDRYSKRLKELKDCLIIATPTNYSHCIYHGLVPDIVMIADSSILHGEHLLEVPLRKETALLASPLAHPEIFSIAQVYGLKTYLFKSFLQSPKGDLNTQFNFFQNYLYYDIPDHLSQAGSVTNQAVLFAWTVMNHHKILDYRVVLIGSDMCIIDNKERCTRYTFDGTRYHEILPHHVTGKEPTLVKGAHNTITNPQMHEYRRSLLSIWGQLHVPIVMVNEKKDDSVLEIPHITFNDILKRTPLDFYDDAFVEAKSKEGLAYKEAKYINEEVTLALMESQRGKPNHPYVVRCPGVACPVKDKCLHFTNVNLIFTSRYKRAPHHNKTCAYFMPNSPEAEKIILKKS